MPDETAGPPPAPPVSDRRGHVQGPSTTAVTRVEYGDYELEMQAPSGHSEDSNTNSPDPGAMRRRDLLWRAPVAVAVAALARGNAVAQSRPGVPQPPGMVAPEGSGLLYPQQNQVRNLLDTSGIWQFQLDPQEEGEAQGWFKALPAPRQTAVPCSWNDLFDEARDYLDLAWYRHEGYIPSGWRGQRVFLRIGSANYAAKVWVNGTVVAEHLSGHLPFVAGMQVWAFADFKTGQNVSRAAGMNFKGVFTRDRKPKMAAYFLRSRWTDTSRQASGLGR